VRLPIKTRTSTTSSSFSLVLHVYLSQFLCIPIWLHARANLHTPTLRKPKLNLGLHPANMGRYAQIKHETDIAVAWVIDTAKAYGSTVHTHSEAPPPSPPPSAPSKPPGRLKGKPRKEAKTAHNQQTPAATAAPKPDKISRQFVTITEILRQKTFLEQLKEVVLMPKYVRSAFTGAIRGRRKYASQYEKAQSTNSANATHVYFIGVLEQLVARFAKFVRVEIPTTDKKEAEGASHTTPISNIFAALNLDETDEK
jgi:hypothetical protein